MSSRENAIIFDDGSIESKVLQHELKTSYDITVVPVEKYEDLPRWLDEAIKKTEGLFKGIIKIILHFPFEDYIQKDIRTQMMELERKYPNIRIIPWYEQAPREGIKNRAANYGIKQETFKAIKQTEVASDIIKGGPEGIRKEGFSKEFIEKLKKGKKKREFY